mgnify:CR=1 FL=1
MDSKKRFGILVIRPPAPSTLLSSTRETTPLASIRNMIVSDVLHHAVNEPPDVAGID